MRLSYLLLLWAMMENKEEKVNSGAHLALQFQRISNTTSGAIVIVPKHLRYNSPRPAPSTQRWSLEYQPCNMHFHEVH
ncbi:hypothetical protein Fmac_009054 [Flemingia macrophylla]|uniref:Secreted protein n=1 Tax=Flemingia macrophylla TaxID=520843 RepID=A0ABD1MZ83_9FABA